MHGKKLYLILIFGLFSISVFSQVRFSVATDIGIIRSLKQDQRFWGVAHITQALFHFDGKNAAYVWIGYTSDGKFHNDLVATAKSSTTIPPEIGFRNNAELRFKHISVGWKNWIMGTQDHENWGLYAYAGFGLMFGRVINTHDPFIDTSLYTVPVEPGKANFKRLTLDVGIAWEQAIGDEVYFYTDGRVFIPTTDYPSDHLFVNNNAPLIAMISAGIRILF